MWLIAGLGNPGAQYAGQRHNIGFMVVDRIHDRHGFAPWRKKFQAAVADGEIDGRKVMLMKPMTYMNESGRAIGEATRFYKLAPDAVIVAHDELDLAPGKLRMKTGGGHGGHNGLRSVTAAIGDGYRRIRLGIGHPGHKDLVHGYVLHDFAQADAVWLEPLLDAVADHAGLLLTGKDSTFANKVHVALADAEPSPGAKPERPPVPAPFGRNLENAAPRTARTNRASGAKSSPFEALKQIFRK